MPLDLPRDLAKEGRPNRTASTPADYHSLVFQGYKPVDGPAVAEVSYDELTPAQKAARTRAENAAQAEAEKNASNQSGGSFTESGSPDEDIRNQAGDANSDA